jgi:hypothetical protein
MISVHGERRTMMRRRLCLGLALAGAMAASGCAIRTGDMTLISTRVVSLDKVDLDKLPTTHRVTGEDWKWNVLFIPLGFPHIKDAVDDALNKGNGDLMTDAVFRQTGWSLILFGQNGLIVEGDVVKTRKQ